MHYISVKTPAAFRSILRLVHFVLILFLLEALTSAPAAESDQGLVLHPQKRNRTPAGDFLPVQDRVELDPKKTAVVICDMWDKHWCQGATRRVGEMAPRMNEVVKKARAQGIFIIHAPSDTMEFYQETPQRKLAQSAPKVIPKVPLQRWNRLDTNRESALPIDDSDGGCDCQPQCKNYKAWSRQIPVIEVEPGDAVTDSEEAYHLLQQRGIDNVLVMGVHANMCVLGRPFSIRQLVQQGKNVLLVRDLTDAMYNPRKAPFVSHARGTDLVVEHIEKFWCPSITSAQLIGGTPQRFKEDKRPYAVFLVGEDEYKTRETLPEFAANELEPAEIKCQFIHADEKNPTHFPGLELIREADLLCVSVRRRVLPNNALEIVRDYVKSGKPIVGIRTASHAFAALNANETNQGWPDFDVQVLGAKYEGHYGNHGPGKPATVAKVLKEAASHPIVARLSPKEATLTSHLYKNRNLASTVTPLVSGTVEGTKDTEPVAWVNTADNRRVFYTSLGNPEDFKSPFFREMFRNSFFWALNHAPKKTNTQSAAIRKQEPLTPAEAAQSFEIPGDLEWEQVLAEPMVRQPVFLDFDERGRMWVVQYLQYPQPAGLKMMSHDIYWRAVYDRVPPPPPHHFRGKDKITIHEDTDGDGRYDSHKTFVEGLSIVTSVVHGRGGVWVLNPPYLLFYPDKNRDDVPDGDPVVHLQGFGLEDTHSVANSLHWGPDGWLYAAQGSTVTGNITVPGKTTNVVSSQGQLIWRYHPETRRYEIFAEGGGNAFGVEIDSKGRIFSGHNGGNTRGFHYQQGAYLRKGFDKHGPLSNPYTFGFFEPMTHPAVERFTHNFIIYEGATLPAAYHGKLFGVEPLQGRVVLSDFQPDGATFKTADLSHPVRSRDAWFRPVDIKLGPDGAVYVADWYDDQVAHLRSHEGLFHSDSGRIYRLHPKQSPVLKPFDLGKKSSHELVELLTHSNKWFRTTALRLIGDRKEKTVIPLLAKKLDAAGPHSLEFLWALNLCGAFDQKAPKLLEHPDPFVRLWTIRLLGDNGKFQPQLVSLAKKETNLEVRSQLACSARRFPTPSCLALVRALASHSEDLKDTRQPLLLWWAIESKAQDRRAVMGFFEDKTIWDLPLVKNFILERAMRRYVEGGSHDDLLFCARLFALSPSKETTDPLLAGLEEGLKGRSAHHFPKELKQALQMVKGGTFELRLRQGDKEAVETALNCVRDGQCKSATRLRSIQVLSEIKEPRLAPLLIELLKESREEPLQKAVLLGLQAGTDEKTGQSVAASLKGFSADNQLLAVDLLSSRAVWATHLLEEIEAGRLEKTLLKPVVMQKLKRLNNPAVQSRLMKLEPDLAGTDSGKEFSLADLEKILQGGGGNPYHGKKIFNNACASCHKLFNKGGELGPDLTAFQRNDLKAMLTSLVYPSAEIREGYEPWLVSTRDGRTLSGFLVETNNRVVVLRTTSTEKVTLERPEIEEMERGRLSLMPEALLNTMSPEEVRNLFAYLRSTQPLND